MLSESSFPDLSQVSLDFLEAHIRREKSRDSSYVLQGFTRALILIDVPHQCKLGLLNRREMGNFFHYWSALDRNDPKAEITKGRTAPIE
jgi:hypothetical protein